MMKIFLLLFSFAASILSSLWIADWSWMAGSEAQVFTVINGPDEMPQLRELVGVRSLVVYFNLDIFSHFTQMDRKILNSLFLATEMTLLKRSLPCGSESHLLILICKSCTLITR